VTSSRAPAAACKQQQGLLNSPCQWFKLQLTRPNLAELAHLSLQAEGKHPYAFNVGNDQQPHTGFQQDFGSIHKHLLLLLLLLLAPNLMQVTVDSCLFRRNSAGFGGAVYIVGRTVASISNCRFTSNDTRDVAGAVFAGGSSTTHIISSTLANNSANWGGAVALRGYVDAVMNNVTCTRNSAATDGGCVCMESFGVS
jgi:predicted outer membrane repeat protein